MMMQHLLLAADHASVVALQNAGGGILQTIRRAIVGFLVVIFAIGAILGLGVGFFVGRAVGRKQAGGSLAGDSSPGSDLASDRS